MPTAQLAFCNDIDFADWNTYCEAHKVLEGELGVRLGDSFWLFDPTGSEMALFKRSVAEKGPKHDQLLAEIQAGHLDVLHAAGNFSQVSTPIRPNRQLIAEGLAYLAQHAPIPKVWTNHGDYGDLTNIGGAKPLYQQGDNPGSEAYILDLLLASGVQYFWLDHHAVNHFVCTRAASSNTSLLTQERTRSGQTITCFHRYRGKLGKAPTASSLHLQLSNENLGALADSDGVSIIYQHWEAHRDASGQAYTAKSPVFGSEARTQLKVLSRFIAKGQIEVLPLKHLLSQSTAQNSLSLRN